MQSTFFKIKPKRAETTTLYDCVGEVFPKLKPEDLEEWQERTIKNSIEPEPLLFIAMICGAYFRNERPTSDELLKELKQWFIQKRMDPELAGLVIEALSPEIKKAIKKKGYKRGWPDGKYISKRGSPAKSRGAWVTALIVENYLRDIGIKDSTANNISVRLAYVLIGRKTGIRINTIEFDRLYTNAPIDNIEKLTRKLKKEYQHFLHEDGIRSETKDYEPPRTQIKKHSEWIDRHKAFENVIRAFKCEGICERVISRVSPELWEPFWDIRIE